MAYQYAGGTGKGITEWPHRAGKKEMLELGREIAAILKRKRRN
jgi:hypothetical protein